jgi:cytochrome c oxidase subunit 2
MRGFIHMFNKINATLVKLLTVISAILPTSVFAAYEYDFPEQVTQVGRELTDLHHFVFFVCLAIMVFVTVWMFYSIFAHRKSRGVKPAKFSHSTTLEIIWTAIPVLILIVMAIPATKMLIKMEDTTKSDVTVKVTGYQWKWQYEYLEDGVDFYSSISTPREQIDQFNGEVPLGENYLMEVDHHMVIPAGKKVRILLTANDVIHAWWVPQLGGKKDAIPGYINQMWIQTDEDAIGTYRGRCAELCGKDHAFMPIVVDVVSQEDYEKWLAVNAGATTAQMKSVVEARDVELVEAVEETAATENAETAENAVVEAEQTETNQ